jgi:hypothetical protein
MASPEKLTCLSIIICDDIYRDERTKKLVIVGTFSTISVRQFPSRHQKMRILFTLTNGHGTYNLKLSIRRARDEKALVEIQGQAKLTNPLQIADIDIEINDLVIPEPGKYWVSLEADGEPIAQRPFMVDQVHPPQGQQPQPPQQPPPPEAPH